MTDDELRRLFDAMRQENAAAHLETRRHSEDLAAATRRHSEELFAQSWRHSEELFAQSRRHSGDLTAETRLHFDITTESMRHEIRLVAEAVVQVREELGRTETRLDDKIERTAAETQAMIKLSHGELDRHLRALEESQPHP